MTLAAFSTAVTGRITKLYTYIYTYIRRMTAKLKYAISPTDCAESPHYLHVL
jgi:hypothetical protein